MDCCASRHAACRHGSIHTHPQMLRDILAAGGDPNIRTKFRGTALDIAIRSPLAEYMLIAAEADPVWPKTSNASRSNVRHCWWGK